MIYFLLSSLQSRLAQLSRFANASLFFFCQEVQATTTSMASLNNDDMIGGDRQQSLLRSGGGGNQDSNISFDLPSAPPGQTSESLDPSSIGIGTQQAGVLGTLGGGGGGGSIDSFASSSDAVGESAMTGAAYGSRKRTMHQPDQSIISTQASGQPRKRPDLRAVASKLENSGLSSEQEEGVSLMMEELNETRKELKQLRNEKREQATVQLGRTVGALGDLFEEMQGPIATAASGLTKKRQQQQSSSSLNRHRDAGRLASLLDDDESDQAPTNVMASSFHRGAGRPQQVGGALYQDMQRMIQGGYFDGEGDGFDGMFQ